MQCKEFCFQDKGDQHFGLGPTKDAIAHHASKAGGKHAFRHVIVFVHFSFGSRCPWAGGCIPSISASVFIMLLLYFCVSYKGAVCGFQATLLQDVLISDPEFWHLQ